MAFRGNSTSAHPVNQNRAPIEPASQEFEKRTTRKVYNFKPSLPEETTNAQTDLIGYEAEPEKILAKIAELQSQLGERDRRNGNPVAGVLPRRATRHLSAAARKIIAEAQKKRWAAYHKKQKAA